MHHLGACIAVVGAGTVGSVCVNTILIKDVGCSEILVTDIDENRCSGLVLDIADATFLGQTRVRQCTTQEASQADIIVITAGASQKSAQSRPDLVIPNSKVMKSIIDNLKPINPKAILIVVTNPVDVMTLVAQENSGLPRTQVFGTGTFLDTERLKLMISERIEVSPQCIDVTILGEHGDSQFPVWSRAQIAGTSIRKWQGMTQMSDLQHITQQTRDKAYDIINKKGATAYGIAACVAALCRAIIFDTKCVYPLSFFVDYLGTCISVPAVLGRMGIGQVVPIELNEEEKGKLAQSAEIIRKMVQLEVNATVKI